MTTSAYVINRIFFLCCRSNSESSVLIAYEFQNTVRILNSTFTHTRRDITLNVETVTGVKSGTEVYSLFYGFFELQLKFVAFPYS